MSDLQPLAPRDGLDQWLGHLEPKRSDATIQSYRYRVEPFVDWCDQRGLDLNDLTSRQVFAYESELASQDHAISTLNNQIGTLKLFLQWCARVDAVDPDLPQRLEVPTSDEFEDSVNETKLPFERAQDIREQLQRYDRASRRQAMFELLVHTGCRTGDLVALDLADLYFEESDLDRLRHRDDVDEAVLEDVEPPFVYFVDREGTSLKNGGASQRPVAIAEHVAERVQEYVDVGRVPGEDDAGRRPLFTSKKGDDPRLSKSSVRRECYIMTQPCEFGAECPHDRDPEDCEAREHGYESRCPSARSPHPIRTGTITHLRDEGWPPEVVGERVDATPETIRKHYDLPDDLRRMQSRRRFVEGTFQ